MDRVHQFLSLPCMPWPLHPPGSQSQSSPPLTSYPSQFNSPPPPPHPCSAESSYGKCTTQDTVPIVYLKMAPGGAITLLRKRSPAGVAWSACSHLFTDFHGHPDSQTVGNTGVNLAGQWSGRNRMAGGNSHSASCDGRTAPLLPMAPCAAAQLALPKGRPWH